MVVKSNALVEDRSCAKPGNLGQINRSRSQSPNLTCQQSEASVSCQARLANITKKLKGSSEDEVAKLCALPSRTEQLDKHI
jgi:hypothetical protein